METVFFLELEQRIIQLQGIPIGTVYSDDFL